MAQTAPISQANPRFTLKSTNDIPSGQYRVWKDLYGYFMINDIRNRDVPVRAGQLVLAPATTGSKCDSHEGIGLQNGTWHITIT
jgi:hypothetical protein